MKRPKGRCLEVLGKLTGAPTGDTVPSRPQEADPKPAIVWKNLMLAHRTPLARLVLYGFVAVGVLSTILAITWVPDGVRSVIAGMLVVAGVMTLVFMPLMAGHQWHNDLRSDLLRGELIRTWPLASWRLFAAEVVAPTIVATLYSAGGAA